MSWLRHLIAFRDSDGRVESRLPTHGPFPRLGAARLETPAVADICGRCRGYPGLTPSTFRVTEPKTSSGCEINPSLQYANRTVALGPISLKKSKNRAGRKLAKLQSDGTSPFNTISDRLRTSHAAQSTNWLVPQLIF